MSACGPALPPVSEAYTSGQDMLETACNGESTESQFCGATARDGDGGLVNCSSSRTCVCEKKH